METQTGKEIYAAPRSSSRQLAKGLGYGDTTWHESLRKATSEVYWEAHQRAFISETVEVAPLEASNEKMLLKIYNESLPNK